MAQNVTIAGASYSGVPAIDVPKSGGGTARFIDPAEINATLLSSLDSDFKAENIKKDVDLFGLVGSFEGGGGGDSAADSIIDRTISGAYTNANVSKIGSYAFYECSSLTEVSFPACTSISSYAFTSCSRLTSAYFPACKTIGNYAFNSCGTLTKANFPACTTIGDSAFVYCNSLTKANFPACTTIGNYAFNNCNSITEVTFPACETIGNYAFYNCNSITEVTFPVCTTIGNYVFIYCTSLTEVSFPACTSIGSYAFRSCRNLLSLYLLGSSVPRLSNTNAFSSTPISNYTTSTGGVHGSIIVQASMLDAFKAATNWSVYSSRFSVWNGVD